MTGSKNDDPLLNLGARLRELRKKAGYTSADTFAFEKGIDRTQWARYERGEVDLQYTSLLKALDALGVSPTEFFNPDIPPATPLTSKQRGEQILSFLKDHPLISVSALCSKVGYDQPNLDKAFSGARAIPAKYLDAFEAELERYGYTQNM